MSVPEEYSFIRYLEAKKEVDDRALNHTVWQRLQELLTDIQRQCTLEILEFGFGIGTMLERLLDGGLLTRAAYTGVDVQPNLIAEAKRRLRNYAQRRGFHVEEEPGGLLSLRRPDRELTLQLVTSDVADFANSETANRAYDLIVAHAFLDLVDLDSILSFIPSVARPGGFAYFTLNFDGATIFEPQIDPSLDAQIESLYHQDMDSRCTGRYPSPMSRTGRRLLAHLANAGRFILAAGSSDWVVYPGPHGYSTDEIYFLHFIVETIRGALTGKPGLDQAAFADWIARRHEQVEKGALIYIAHQLDVLARVRS